jgi:hypothetical protein
VALSCENYMTAFVPAANPAISFNDKLESSGCKP